VTSEPKGPGQAASDPARRPGQPGAQRQLIDDAAPEVVRGPADDRGIPVNGVVGEQVSNEPNTTKADKRGEPGALSEGSVRAGPA
jgi:hypothetical protein